MFTKLTRSKLFITNKQTLFTSNSKTTHMIIKISNFNIFQLLYLLAKIEPNYFALETLNLISKP